jgi:hypothetical protein
MPDGHHEFRVSLAEHQQAVRTARRAWNAVRGIKTSGARPDTSATPRTRG